MNMNKFTPENRYIIIKYALESQNITKTCKLFGISRTSYYKWYNRYQKMGVEGLNDMPKSKPKMPNRVSKEIENIIIKLALESPKDGPRRLSYELEDMGIDVGETGVYNTLKRYNLNTSNKRLQYAKSRGIRVKNKKKVKKPNINFSNIANTYPGYVMQQGTNYIGKFESLGKIYQIATIDCYSNFAFAKVYPNKESINVINLMETKIFPMAESLDLEIDNLITNNSLEYSTSWDKAQHKYDRFLIKKGIKHWAIPSDKIKYFKFLHEFNSIIHEEFYTDFLMWEKENYSIRKIQAELNKFMRYYNFERPLKIGHNKGKTPIEVIVSTKDKDFPLPLWFYVDSIVESDGKC